MYGSKFEEAWQTCIDDAIDTWSEGLAGFTADEISSGLRGCMSRDWPPTLPEFAKLCRPPLDYDVAYATAVEQMRLRDSGRDCWPQAAIFWAAASLGSDLRALPAAAIRGRWRVALDAALADVASGALAAVVPARAIALPAPAPLSRDEAARVLAEVESRAGYGLGAPPPKAWAHEIKKRYLAGEPLFSIQIANASEALGETWGGGKCSQRIAA